MSKVEVLKNECIVIEDNARHTAESHYIIASHNYRTAFFLEIIPAIVASCSGLLVVGAIVPLWWGWITVVSAVITATSSVISPHKSYFENLNAAKAFTVVKNRAKSLQNLSDQFDSEEEYFKEVKSLSEYYNQLILLTPPTQEWAYSRAKNKLSNLK